MKKKVFGVVVFLFSVLTLQGQYMPLGINYQAIARDNAGNELKNTNLSVRVSIISEEATGNAVYAETHSVTTDLFGLFKLVIGQGSYYSGTVDDFADISWGSSSHFLKVEVNFGDGFISMGTMPFLAVPYALYAANAGDTGGEEDLDTDPENELQVLSSDGTSLSISGGNTIPLNDIVEDDDADPGNEIQDLKLEGQKLRLTENSDPTIIDLEPYLDNTDNQELRVDQDNQTLSIDRGNTVAIDADPENEIQELSLSGYELSLSKQGGNVNIKPPVIAFRGKKTSGETGYTAGNSIFLEFTEELDIGDCFDNQKFVVPPLGEGLYYFQISYAFDGKQNMTVFKNGEPYEEVFSEYSSLLNGIENYSFILYLNEGDSVKLEINFTNFSNSQAGQFFGYRIH
jgi:hypothetical protein